MILKLDHIDKSILNILQQNSRLSFSEIGRQIGRTGPAVAERIEKLEDSGVIKRFGVVLDYTKLGYSMQVIIELKTFMGKLNGFLKVVESTPEIKKCYRVTGDKNVIILTYLKDQKELLSLINQLSAYGDTTTMLILDSIIDFKSL